MTLATASLISLQKRHRENARISRRHQDHFLLFGAQLLDDGLEEGPAVVGVGVVGLHLRRLPEPGEVDGDDPTSKSRHRRHRRSSLGPSFRREVGRVQQEQHLLDQLYYKLYCHSQPKQGRFGRYPQKGSNAK